MTAPHCPEHRSLMLDLVRGRLEGSEARAAEDLRRTCPACRTWSETQLSGPFAEAVDRAVAEAFDEFESRRQPRYSGWLRLAVAAALVLGLGLVLRWAATDAPAGRPASPEGELIVAITSEQGGDEPLEWMNRGASRRPAGPDRQVLADSPSEAGQVIFRAGSEPGDPAAWTQPEGLFRGGFEDGSTEVWTDTL